MDISIGQIAAIERTFTQSDFDRFAAICGDDNPIHVDPGFSARTRFGKTVSHGMLLYATINRALSEHFPGARQLEQEMMYPAPTFVGETVEVRLEVLDVWPETRLARLKTLVTKSSGETVCDGQTLVQWRAE